MQSVSRWGRWASSGVASASAAAVAAHDELRRASCAATTNRNVCFGSEVPTVNGTPATQQPWVCFEVGAKQGKQRKCVSV